MYELLGSLSKVVFVFGIITYVMLAGFVPLMIWSAVRSLKGIHRELRRLNDEREPASDSRTARSGIIGL